MSTDQISKIYRSQLMEMAQNRESYSETTIPVNWDCPVWKCGNLISTGDVLSIPEPPQLIGHAGRLFRVSRSNQLHFPLAMSRNVVTTLGVSTPASNLLVSLPRTRGVYLPPSLLLIPLPLFLPPPLYTLNRCTLTNFWRGQRPGAIRSEGFLLQRNHYIYAIPYRIYFRKANHRIPLQDIYSFNGTCRRGSNTRPIVALRRDQNSHHFSPRINTGQSIRGLIYPLRADEIFGLITLLQLFLYRESSPIRGVFCFSSVFTNSCFRCRMCLINIVWISRVFVIEM